MKKQPKTLVQMLLAGMAEAAEMTCNPAPFVLIVLLPFAALIDWLTPKIDD